MNELLNELLTLIDQNVIRIQPYTLDDSQRLAIQARLDDWTRRARIASAPVVSEIDKHNAEYFRRRDETIARLVALLQASQEHSSPVCGCGQWLGAPMESPRESVACWPCRVRKVLAEIEVNHAV